ncbi:vacuolar protein sorting-associated protein 8 homolog [Harmonia axyridis]|uniref:vacuolar protein sorting-associated protein 8 homolog n=1 Tax=Harmonia axyridis TaxID=115357 RepID=UPI001E278C47|nr:vacuolar protein sorting-associated protein 8 homolog [Harmonia axyridis]XP_045462003.1 vacuolar protein sorting-associated protein 8 homolog [Harmonia axyridis]
MSTDCEVEDTDSLLDITLKINDSEFDIPPIATPSLESILWDMESEEGSVDNASIHSFQSMETKSHSVLSYCILQGISAQITSAGERVSAGMPTVITNSSKYIAVGTSHGYILNFNPEQSLCWCCHDLSTGDQGAISSLAFNLDSTRLLAGYERGYILMIDANNGDVLRRLPDAHAPQTAVLHLRFTFLNNLALCGDSSGCVFSLSFHRRLGVRSWDSRCLFSGATGEVCVFEPLVHGYDLQFLSRNVLVAMATMSKVIVISVRPQLKCLFSHPLPKISTSLPQISWQLVSIGKIYQPVLAWGRGNELNFTRLIIQGSKNVKLMSLRNIQLPYSSIAIQWLGSQHLALIDTSENLHLLDVRSQKELEVLELASAELVYNSAHFKALALGGGVSEAFSLAGERACYNSISSRGDQLLLLGTKAVHMVKLRSWPERIMYLSDKGRWSEALNLAAEEGTNKERFATYLLLKYFDSLNQNTVDKESLVAAVKCCVKLNKIDFLCNELWEAISNDYYNQDWYYFLLTDHIVNGKLTSLTPFIAQCLVSHLEKKDVQTLENVLLMLEISCLDLHQVLTICKRYKLYNAWIHITTKTLGDYTSPITEFLSELTPANLRLGNTMLVYVSSCLAGLGYPNGNIPKEDITRVKFDVLRCLEALHSINGTEHEKTYPYLRSLLKFNMRECLNVIELAFTEVVFSGEMGLLHRQRLVNILMQIVTPPEFPETEEINLACFICRLVTSSKLNLEDSVLEKIYEVLVKETSQLIKLRDHMEREQAWLDLMSSNRLNHSSHDKLLESALVSKCFRVAEYLYELKNDYSDILKCYLNDRVRKNEVFNYILKYIDDEDRSIREQFLVHFKELVEIDSKQTTDIVIDYFPDMIETFCEMLEGENDLRYHFLKELINCDIKLPPKIAEIYLDLLSVKDQNKVRAFLELGFCRMEEALEITRRHNVHAATALLLEQGGEWLEALELLLEHNLVDYALSLCIRGAEHLDSEGAQKLWMVLLQHEKSSENMSLRQLLHATAPHIPPAQLLELVSNVKFGDIRVSLQGILSDYRHDITMHSTTLQLLSRDLHKSLAQTLGKNGKGVYFTNTCNICHHSLSIFSSSDKGAVSVYGCGHCFHQGCIVTSESIESTCPLCKTKCLVLPKSQNRSRHTTDINSRLRPDLEGHF